MLRVIKQLWLGWLALIVVLMGVGTISLPVHPIPVSNPEMLLHVALGSGAPLLARPR